MNLSDRYEQLASLVVLDTANKCLVWNSEQNAVAGKPVKPGSAIKILELSDEESDTVDSIIEGTLQFMKQRKKDGSKTKAEVRREEKRAARSETEKVDNQLYTIAKDWLKRHVRIQLVDRKILLSITKGPSDTFTFYSTNPDFGKRSTMNSFLLNLRSEIGQVEYTARIKEMEDIIYASYEIYKEAGVPSPDVHKILRHVLESEIFFGVVPECIIDDTIPLLSWGNQSATCVLDLSLLQPGPTPNFDSILARVDFPEELMAFVWKVFDESDCKGRQMAWGYSPGNSGQSVFWRAIHSAIPSISAAMSKTSYSNQFSESKFYRKRFAIMGDCPDPKYYMHHIVKKLTGGDLGDIEFKSENSFAAPLWCRVVLYSNFYPEVDITDNAFKTRLLLFQFQSVDAGTEDIHIEEKLKAEVWHFLWKCREVEKRLCNGRSDIPIPPDMAKEIFLRCESPYRRVLHTFIQKRVEPDMFDSITEPALWGSFRKYAFEVLEIKGGFQLSFEKEKDSIMRTADRILSGMGAIKEMSDNGSMHYTEITLLKD